MFNVRKLFRTLLTCLALSLVVVGAGIGGESATFAQTPPPTPPAPAPATPTGWFDSLMSKNGSIKEEADQYEASFGQNCWSCTVFQAFSDIVFRYGMDMSEKASEPLLKIMSTMAVLFSLVYLGSSFVTGDASDLPQKFKVFWRFMLAVAFGGVALSYSGGGAFGFVWTYVFGPILLLPMSVAEMFTSASFSGLTSSATCPGFIDPDGSAGVGATEIMSSMYGVVCDGHKMSARGVGAAFAILFSSTYNPIAIMYNLVVFFVLAGVFIWLGLSFPLRFIDILIRLAVLGILSPFLIVAAVFKPTRSYAIKAISEVLYCGFLFCFVAILARIGGSIFTQIVEAQLAADIGGFSPVEMASSSLAMVGAAIVLTSMIKMAPALAKEFSGFQGQSSGGVGDTVGGAMSGTASIATKAAGAGVGFAGQVMVAKAVGKAMGGLGRGVS